MNSQISRLVPAPLARSSPTVTYALIAAMAIVSLPTVAYPRLYDVFGGVGTLAYPWQVVTSAFEHGWPGVPLLPHLIGNLILLWVVGIAAERLLGAWRYLILTLAALALYVVARWLSGLDANGASVFIWAYAPIVYVGRRRLAENGDADRYNAILFIMWVAVPLFMALAIPFPPGVGTVLALLAANAFHISATVAGLAGVVSWWHDLQPDEGMPQANAAWAQAQSSTLDRRARLFALLIPLSLAGLLAAALAGWV